MDATTAGLVLVGLTALFLWGYYLGYCYGRAVECAHRAESRAKLAAAEAALAKSRRDRLESAVKLTETQDVTARLREHGEWIEENLDAIANRPDTRTNEGA